MPNEQIPSPESADPDRPSQPPEGQAWPMPDAPGRLPPQTSPWPTQGTPPWPGPNPGAWSQAPFPPPTASRARARAWVVGSAVAIAAALIAGTLGYVIGTQHSRIGAAVQNFKAAAAGPCRTGQTTPDPSATSPAGAALLTGLLPMPRGATQVKVLKQGVLSLRDYIKELYPGNSTEQLRLTTRCFRTAVHRTWQMPDGTITSVWLIQFGTAADARSYTLATEQGDAADPANTDKFTVARVMDGMGLARPALDKYGNTLTRLLGDAGNISIIIHILIPARTDDIAAAHVLLHQNARLSGGSS